MVAERHFLGVHKREKENDTLQALVSYALRFIGLYKQDKGDGFRAPKLSIQEYSISPASAVWSPVQGRLSVAGY